MTMTNTRLIHLATAAALSALTLTGCGALSDAAATPTASASHDPQLVLIDAVPDEKTAAYSFKSTGGAVPISGVSDLPNKAVDATILNSDAESGITMRMDVRMVGGKAWVKLKFTPDVAGLPKLPKKWMLIDETKLSDKTFMDAAEEADPGDTLLLIQGSAGIKETSPGHYTGTTDLTRDTEGNILDAATVKALGAKAKTLPFTAVVDGAGHLTSVVVKIPAAGKTKAQTYTVTYGDFGKTATPAAPAVGEQQAAPASLYELLNS
jgi:hypothetical protein